MLKFQYFKFQIPTINNLITNKPFDLEEKTYLFARDCRLYVKKLPKTISNIEDGKQLVRASGSVGANYIEANEKLGDKDLAFRLKIARKEAKESKYWVRLLEDLNPDLKETSNLLFVEAEELRKILSSIISKTS